MFDQLFCRSDALTRQLSAPLVDETPPISSFMCGTRMSKCTMEVKARLLLSIAEYLRLGERPNDTSRFPRSKKRPVDGRSTIGLHRRARKPSGRENTSQHRPLNG